MDRIKLVKAYEKINNLCDTEDASVEVNINDLYIILKFVRSFEGGLFPTVKELEDYYKRSEILELVDKNSQTYKDLQAEQDKFNKKYNQPEDK